MPLPWAQKEEEETATTEPVFRGNVEAPVIQNPVAIEQLDQFSYRKNCGTLFKNRETVASAKANCDRLDEFCEQNIVVLNNDSSQVSDDYDIDKDLKTSITDERLSKNLLRVSIKSLNAVQRKSVRVIRDGLGLLLEAPTGIGKTYAFLIPAIEKVIEEKRNRSIEPKKPAPIVLIIANTGTLVKQVYDRCELILGLKCMDDVEPMHDVKIDMLIAEHHFTRDACDIAFATMGKLKATIEAGDVILDNLKMIILDEADKMIDPMAFGMDIDNIMNKLSEEVKENLQACFFSATYPRDSDGSIVLTAIQTKMLGDKPWRLVYCPRMPGYITQKVIRLPRPTKDIASHDWIVKMNVIRSLIDKDLEETNCKKEGPYEQTIAIFCETVGRAAQVATALRLLGYNFSPLCRLLTKQQQAVTVNDLEFKRIHGVVCTNIMSRGIDVSSIKHTIIMEMSNQFDTYKHRIGRVGRDGNGGTATVLIDHNTLLNGRSAAIVDQLYTFMKQSEQEIPEWLEQWFRSRHPQDFDYA
ncbi:CRE-MUT-14 protein [Caenorhabditis remanei]|uniref:RNA helicase n=1 Tax=Caenorhabditis remanei TaxID=31234 RepID=E3LUL9_CAERE|nr:CRE-MUT-14 protein [Caenorhabditis remanei]